MYICIEGNIGVGKTTFAMALSARLKADFLPERFENNTLLPLFYNEPKKYAFPTEYSFLIDRQKQLVNYFNAQRKKSITVSDFHFDKCFCFAQANLSRKDFLFYKKHFKAIQKTVPNPDLIIYLSSSSKLLIKNIKKRGRSMEKKIKEEYLEALEKSYDTYYSSKRKKLRLLKIQIEEYNSETLNFCYDKIEQALKTIKI